MKTIFVWVILAILSLSMVSESFARSSSSRSYSRSSSSKSFSSTMKTMSVPKTTAPKVTAPTPKPTPVVQPKAVAQKPTPTPPSTPKPTPKPQVVNTTTVVSARATQLNVTQGGGWQGFLGSVLSTAGGVVLGNMVYDALQPNQTMGGTVVQDGQAYNEVLSETGAVVGYIPQETASSEVVKQNTTQPTVNEVKTTDEANNTNVPNPVFLWIIWWLILMLMTFAGIITYILISKPNYNEE